MAHRVRRAVSLASILACALSAGCGSPSPAAPSIPAAPLAAAASSSIGLSGLWRGYMTSTTCTSGDCGNERTLPFVLRVAPGGPGFVGSFEPSVSGWLNLVVDVSGASQPDGAVLFTGTRGSLGGDLFTYEVLRLSVRVDQSAGLTGDVELRGSHPTAGTRSLTGRILSASHLPDVAVPGASFSGTWTGLFVIQTCSGYCPSFMTAGSTERFELALGQSTTAVTGRLTMSNFFCGGCWLPVSGTVSGSQVALSSETITRDPANGIGDKTMVLESFAGSLDAMGRMSGRLVYSSMTRNYATPADVSYRIEGEILWCTRSWPAVR